MTVRAKKHLGQHFLTDENIAEDYKSQIAKTELPFVLEKSVEHLQKIIDEV